MNVLGFPAFKNRDECPYTWLLYSNMKANVYEFSKKNAFARNYDIFHLHWPEGHLNDKSASHAFLHSVRSLAIIDLLKLKGTKVVWTTHNLKSHDRRHSKLEAWFWRRFTKRVDAFIGLSSGGVELARTKMPHLRSKPASAIPLGHFRGEYPDEGDAGGSRKLLNLDPGAKVILYLGQIRPYKNVPGLIRVFREMADANTVLCVAGKPVDSDTAEEVRRAAAGDPRIHLSLQHVPKDRVQHYFRAADLVVLPYRDILNSGTAILALSFDRPVLVPLLGAMGELADFIGPEWVRTYKSELSGQELADSLFWALQKGRPLKAPLGELDWDSIAARTLHLFEQITGQQGQTKAANANDAKRARSQAAR